MPFLRSCRLECSTPVRGLVKGEIPKWLSGNLVRIGPGLLECGNVKLNHVFDGLSLMHRFEIKDGAVSYQNKFLRSDIYKECTEKGRLAYDMFGSNASPDPCMTIFQRIASTFSERESVDNANINIIKYSDEYYACTETNYIWRIDPDTLASLEKVDLRDYVFVKGATAHSHTDPDGTVYNVGFHAGPKSGYAIIKFSPKEGPGDQAHGRASIICNIPFHRQFYPCYFHSFGITENYFVLLEQPLIVSLPRMILRRFTGSTMAEIMSYDNNQKTRFHVVRRSDGILLPTTYLAEKLFVFHHINAYEDDGHLVIDLCSYDDGRVVKELFIHALKKCYYEKTRMHCQHSYAKRYILPVKFIDESNEEENLVKLEDSHAKAFRQKDGNIFCQPELLTDGDDYYPELPRINYEGYNGTKYRYFYAVAVHRNNNPVDTLIKVDTKTKGITIWCEDGALPSEPVFVANPDNSETDEDSGVIMTSLLFSNDEKKVALLVLDAKTMIEKGRAEFETESAVPGTFHAIFVKS